MKVKANCVYVIPPNKSMSILHGCLHLFEPLESRGLRLPIDIFFRSLAEDQQEKSIGVIFSGMGSDGSQGVKAIKEKNGLVLVQDPHTAKFDGMPRSAMDAVVVDIIAATCDLPKKLLSLLQVVPFRKSEFFIGEQQKTSLDKIIILLREKSGHDFSLYKKNTLLRRIERRQSIHQLAKIHHYVRFLQENPNEVELLFKELLIGVTSFFRDPIVWEKLKMHILPKFLKDYPEGYTFRAWVTGCSTGEEAYSLAIVFKEVLEMDKNLKGYHLQIFATDIDIDAIDKARRGIFPKNISVDVSKERLNRFFTEDLEGYKINIEIRELLVFATHNVIKDPPFTKIDLLVCRNLLIYMESDLQKKVLNLFQYSLNPNGIILLGTAESFGSEPTGFAVLDTKLKIFKRMPQTVSPELIDFPSSFSRSNKFAPSEKKNSKGVKNIQTITEQILLQRYTPPSVLVNENGDILYITGKTGRYLEPVAGKANWNIHAMARDGLRHELPSAFRKAKLNFEPIYLRGIKLGNNGATLYVDVTIQQLEEPISVKGMIVVIFTEIPNPNFSLSKKEKTTKGKQSFNQQVKLLESKLQQSNEELQRTREEMQTSQEELKSTNEELQSTNEELQSTNEELTTSKEEMQSLNEELQTMNIELQNKINDFAQSNDDMKNLLNSTDIATLFLDKELNIRRFTEPATSLFKLRITDTGRPFTDLVTDLQYPEMEAHARAVIKNLTIVEQDVSTKNERWYNVKILPYRTLDDRIDGIVITFIDITKFKKMEQELKAITQPQGVSDGKS